jgi:hypothetical protein
MVQNVSRSTKFAEDATLSCDGWSSYPAYHLKLQRCWAHLLREAEFVADRYDEAQQLCEELHELHDDLTTFIDGDPSASARQDKRAEAMLHLEGLTRRGYANKEVTNTIGYNYVEISGTPGVEILRVTIANSIS